MFAILMTGAQLLFTLFMYGLGILFFGVSLMPGLALWFKQAEWTANASWGFKLFAMGLSLAAGYFLFGLTLILLVGLFRTLTRLRLQEGVHPLFSLEALKWALISSLYLMINFTFIEFVLLTPFANLLFRMLGAKLGKNVQINSRHFYDASLVEIGDNTVLGGNAIINGHTVERGRLRLRKVKIGKNVTIGSHATIMPGCEIGDNAIIGASAVLLKNSKVGPREVWFGLPAQNIRKRHSTDNKIMGDGHESGIA